MEGRTAYSQGGIVYSMGSYIIIFLFGVFVGSMVSCAVLSAVMLSGRISREEEEAERQAKLRDMKK